MSTKTTTDGADAPAPTFTFSAALADQARAKRDELHEFALTATMPGAFAKVRVPDMEHPDVLIGLPDSLLRSVLRIVRSVEQGGAGNAAIDPANDDPDTIDLARAKEQAVRNRALVDAYCICGFVDPPLAYSEEYRPTPEHVLISDIHPADRSRFFTWCLKQLDGEATATVEPFPAGPVARVATRGSRRVDRGTPEPVGEVA